MPETISLRDIFSELKKIERKMVTREEIESLAETIEILKSEKRDRS